MSAQPDLFDKPFWNGKTLGELIDICERKHKGNPQSTAAFQKIKPRLTLKQAVVLQFIRECGERGATTDEAAVHFDVYPNQVSGRFSELKRDGKIVEDGRKRPTRNGSPAAVCKAI